MSQSQYSYDEASQSWRRYDYKKNRWIYYDTAQPSHHTRNSVEQGSSSTIRQPHSYNEASNTAFHQQWSQPSYPLDRAGNQHSQYQYSNDTSIDHLSAAFQNQTIQDETPRREPRLASTENRSATLIREPKEEVTDPELYSSGFVSHGKIGATNGDKETLDPDYKVQYPADQFFVPGKVFKILWPEHPGINTTGVTVITDEKFRNAQFITKIRWFVVVKAGQNCCSCLPISTYSRRGCAKGVQKWQHSMVYTGHKPPKLLDGESPQEGEDGMMLPIRVKAKHRGTKMLASSRIDYSRIYTVEHYVKVKDFGRIVKEDVKTFREQWAYVLAKETDNNYQLAATRGWQEDEYEDSGDESGGNDGNNEDESHVLEWVTAIADFSQKNMMELCTGDRIAVTYYSDEHWWRGTNLRTNETALFPTNHIRKDP